MGGERRASRRPPLSPQKNAGGKEAFREAILARAWSSGARCFGPEGAEIQVDNASPYLAPMQDIVTRICFGEVWQRPVLDLRDPAAS